MIAVSMIEINLDPSDRDLKQFGLLLLAFFGALGGIVLWRPEALVGAAVFLTVAVTISLVFNNTVPRKRQLLGLVLPAVFSLVGQSVLVAGLSPWATASVLWIAGVLLSGAVWAVPAVARRFFLGWMFAAEPIGWTLSHAILAIVFYGVITPIGVVMRCLGRDLLQRRWEPDAATYWQRRKPITDVKRYFRQF